MSENVSATALRDIVGTATRRERRSLARFTTLALTGGAAEASIPWLVGAVLDAALSAHTSRLSAGIAAMAAAIAVGIASNVTRHVIAARLKVRVSAELRRRVGDRIAGAPHEVAAHIPAAQVATVVSFDVDRMAAFLIARIRLLAAVVSMLIVATYLAWISPVIAVVVFIGVPVFMWLAARIAAPLEERQDRHRELLGSVVALSSDIGLGLRVVRGLGSTEIMRARFAEASKATERAGIEVAKTQALLLTSGAVLPGILLTGLVWFGSHLASSGSFAPGSLVTFYAAAAYLVAPITTAAGFGDARSSARVAAKRIEAVLSVPESPWTGTETPVPVEDDLVDGSTRLRVRAGAFSVVSVDGTEESEQLGRRLAGLAFSGDDDGDGSADVTLGGRPLTGFDRDALRQAVRYHGPRSTIFSGTVRDALDPAGRHSAEELDVAMRVAAADDVVERLGDGLRTQIDADGRSVSGGQRQRLALARSILGDPPVLILVEPTTALDAVTEIEVARRIAAHRNGRTTLVVSRSGAFRAVADHVLTTAAVSDV